MVQTSVPSLLALIKKIQCGSSVAKETTRFVLQVSSCIQLHAVWTRSNFLKNQVLSSWALVYVFLLVLLVYGHACGHRCCGACQMVRKHPVEVSPLFLSCGLWGLNSDPAGLVVIFTHWAFLPAHSFYYLEDTMSFSFQMSLYPTKACSALITVSIAQKQVFQHATE